MHLLLVQVEEEIRYQLANAFILSLGSIERVDLALRTQIMKFEQ